MYTADYWIIERIENLLYDAEKSRVIMDCLMSELNADNPVGADLMLFEIVNDYILKVLNGMKELDSSLEIKGSKKAPVSDQSTKGQINLHNDYSMEAD